MPNLVGIWHPELPEESIRTALSRQLTRVRTAAAKYQEHVLSTLGFGAALQDHGILENGPQPVTSDDGNTSLFLDGEIYNALDLRCRYRRDLPVRALTTPELCLQLILRHGSDVAREFNGLFCIVVYARRARRLTLISDPYAFRPLFYVKRPTSLIFGTELKALAAVDSEKRCVDPIGTLEMFAYGSHVLDRTWLEGYVRLPPATVLTVDSDGLRSHPYWVYRYDESAPRLDQATYVTVFGTLLDRAVERCMSGSHRVGIFLSGGYDSRAVAASIRDHHLPIPAFTFGHSASRDVRFATMLAKRLGFDHYTLTSDEPYLRRYCRSIVWRTEGLLSFSHVTSMRYHPVLKERMDIILTGFLAEFGGSHTWPRLLLARGRRAAIDAIYQRTLGDKVPAARRLFNRAFFERTYEAVRARFFESCERVPNEQPLNIADVWNVVNLQPRGSYQSPSVDRHLFEVRAPHMDLELVRFLLTIPAYARLEQRVYKQMIAYRFPAIRDVPCTNSGKPIDPHFAREYTLMAARYLGRKALQPVRALLPRKDGLGRSFRDLDAHVRAEPELVSDILEPLLQAGMFPSEIFDHAGIRAIVDEQYRQGGQHEGEISRLISWGLATKYFLHDELADVPTELYAP
jgi:asparagine synthetase B (glutamine-hydrolysing)